MLSEKQIEDKLYEQAGLFKHYFARKEYLRAALCVDWTRMVALFVELEEGKRVELFGDRQPDEPIEGLINEERYLKACEWCICKGGYAYTRHTLENVQSLRQKREHRF